jgi:hypothetical protein
MNAKKILIGVLGALLVSGLVWLVWTAVWVVTVLRAFH